MRTFRTLLAILFSLLIVGGIWKYYTSNDHVSVADPFAAVWKKFASYQAAATPKDTPEAAPKEVILPKEEAPVEVGSLHADFTLGVLDQATVSRVTSNGILGGNPNADVVWLQRCDFDAKYCQKSFDKGVLYDYVEAYPTELKYMFKSFPLGTDKEATLPHHATMCAMDLGTPKQYFSYFNTLYSEKKIRNDEDKLIELGRELGIKDFTTCIEETSYNLVFQQETKLAKKTFDLKALPANVFLNTKTGRWVLVPGRYDTKDVLPAIQAVM